MREREAAYQTQQRARILDEIVEAAAAGTPPCCALSQPLPCFAFSPLPTHHRISLPDLPLPPSPTLRCLLRTFVLHVVAGGGGGSRVVGSRRAFALEVLHPLMTIAEHAHTHHGHYTNHGHGGSGRGATPAAGGKWQWYRRAKAHAHAAQGRGGGDGVGGGGGEELLALAPADQHLLMDCTSPRPQPAIASLVYTTSLTSCPCALSLCGAVLRAGGENCDDAAADGGLSAASNGHGAAADATPGKGKGGAGPGAAGSVWASAASRPNPLALPPKSALKPPPTAEGAADADKAAAAAAVTEAPKAAPPAAAKKMLGRMDLFFAKAAAPAAGGTKRVIDTTGADAAGPEGKKAKAGGGAGTGGGAGGAVLPRAAGRVHYKFNQGFSNAVRRPVTVAEFL